MLLFVAYATLNAFEKDSPFSPVTNLSTEEERIRHHIFLYGN